jgi:hypothetical protein
MSLPASIFFSEMLNFGKSKLAENKDGEARAIE